jgi:hypothetical protein
MPVGVNLAYGIALNMNLDLSGCSLLRYSSESVNLGEQSNAPSS